MYQKIIINIRVVAQYLENLKAVYLLVFNSFLSFVSNNSVFYHVDLYDSMLYLSIVKIVVKIKLKFCLLIRRHEISDINTFCEMYNGGKNKTDTKFKILVNLLNNTNKDY
mmetsp:Transcript_21995/g.30696  ORF Transcript_21995/g.30696 Transcript_21995/m.30696 type:complete len:110 (+) Transcript_21995:651-980(+)